MTAPRIGAGASPALRRTAQVLTLAFAIAASHVASAQGPAVFATADEAVQALRRAARAQNIEPMIALLGADGRDLASSSDPATARQNRDVFVIAMREGWRLVDLAPDRKELVIGREAWPFPVPLVRDAAGWRFDTAAGREEILTRRIGRNELAAIQTVRTYVTAQRVYARQAHDGVAAGAYARRFASSPGKHDGLYWPVDAGQAHSPLGVLVAEAAAQGRATGDGRNGPVPFRGYYFRILERQGRSVSGGAKTWVVDGAMTGGFGVIAWPAEYGATGIMSFLVGSDGVVYERDYGSDTASAVTRVMEFEPTAPWQRVSPTVIP